MEARLGTPGGELRARTLVSCFLRCYLVGAAFNTRGLQHVGLAYAMEPGLARLYPDPAQRDAVFERYLKLYSLAWGLLILGTLVLNLNLVGLIGMSWISTYGQLVGLSIEALLLSFVLGARMNDLQRERTLDQTGDQLLEIMMRTINGRFTAAEALGHREFVLTRLFESA